MIRRRRDSGVSMIELIIALAVMVLALIALMSSVMSSSRVSDTSKESALAYEAARAKIEEMRTYTNCSTFSNIYNYYKKGQTPNTASVTGLNPVMSGGVAQPVLQIMFPVATTTSPYNLTETLVTAATDTDLNYIGQRLGMPKDLNRNGSDVSGTVAWDTGDSTGSATDLNSTYGILPVMIRVTWETIGRQTSRIEVVTYITEK